MPDIERLFVDIKTHNKLPIFVIEYINLLYWKYKKNNCLEYRDQERIMEVVKYFKIETDEVFECYYC